MALATPTSSGVLADSFASSWARNAILVVAGAVFVGLAAQIAIPLPFTPVPVTGQTFAVLLTGAAFGMWRGAASMVLYAIMGLAGIPWFASGTSAFNEGALTVTFGYIVGFIAAAALVGWLAEKGYTTTVARTAGLMALGTIVIYAIGATWLAIALAVSPAIAFDYGIQPFLIGDALKIALAAGLFPIAWQKVKSITNE